ncbi:MAG: preprotein translocase subunit YajC [Clostridia bacterium]|nr:preprotein translocase subunit YajC [Clostridia bacterium]
MFGSILSLDQQYLVWIIIAVVLVLMIVLTIVPQKKRQKEQQNMMNSLAVGTKIMTIGRMVGKITQVNSDNTLIVNVGTESSPTLIVIDKQAVGLVLEAVQAPAPAPVAEEAKEEAPAEEKAVEEAPAEEVKEEAAPEEKTEA